MPLSPSCMALRNLDRQSLVELFEVEEAELRKNDWLCAGACTAKGRREANEDQYMLLCDWSCVPEWRAALFAVCDGHGGPAVAVLACRFLRDQLLAEMMVEENGVPSWSSAETRRAAVERAFLAVDVRLGQKEIAQGCGSTCTVAIVWPDSEAESHGGFRALIASIGDSRGLVVCGSIGSRIPQGGLVAETIDHKPDQPQEQERILSAGGRVSFTGPVARVDGDLAMSRAFGDFRMKADPSLQPAQQKISALPDIREFFCEPGDVILLACDGAFDVFASDEVATLAHGVLAQTSCGEHGAPASAAEAVVMGALRQGTMDNVTCVLLQSRSASQYSPPSF